MGGILLALLRVSFPQFDFGVVKSEDVGKSGEGYLAERSPSGGDGRRRRCLPNQVDRFARQRWRQLEMRDLKSDNEELEETEEEEGERGP